MQAFGSLTAAVNLLKITLFSSIFQDLPHRLDNNGAHSDLSLLLFQVRLGGCVFVSKVHIKLFLQLFSMFVNHSSYYLHGIYSVVLISRPSPTNNSNVFVFKEVLIECNTLQESYPAELEN